MEQPNHYKALARDTRLFAISSFGSKLLLFLLTPLYTNILSVEEYGIVDILVTTVDFIYPLLTLAISESALRFAMDKAVSKKSVFSMSLGFVLLSTVLLFLFWPFVGMFSETISQYYFYFCLIYFLFNAQLVFANFIKGIDKTKTFAVQGLLQTITVIMSNLTFLLVFRIGLDGYLLSIILGYVVSTMYMLIAGKLQEYIDLKSFDRVLIKEMLGYSIPMIPTILAWTINRGIDKYMIVGFAGLGESGVYSVAHKIPALITTVLMVFIQAWQISAIQVHGKKDESEFYSKTYAILNILCIAASCMLIPLTKFMAGFLFSKDFYVAWRYVPLLCLSAMFASLAGFLASGFRAAKKTKGLFISVAVGAVINIVLNMLLLPVMGVIGAALATAISFLVVWIVRVFSIQKIISIQISCLSALLSFVLLFFLCLAYVYEIPYFFLLYVSVITLILFLNRKDILLLLRGMLVFFKKILGKKK